MKRAIFLFFVFWLTPVLTAPSAYGGNPPALAEYIEYEKIVLTPLLDPLGPPIPNWRELYLAKIAQYENYLKRYPNSPLAAEVKFRIAELMLDTERPDIYRFRVKMYQCLAENAGESAEKEALRQNCIREFEKAATKWRDPFYVEKAVKILFELVEKYGHKKRYSMAEPKIGGFEWDEEEIGAQALYLLSRGADPSARKRILLLILKEYKSGPRLKGFVEEDLKKLENTK
ncbi:MAG: hypothetical protein HYW90_01855 [Candidatus Sungbacteria bacterium]|nr:hypothetical protein [Candidatus Sungbacteria bacterium]